MALTERSRSALYQGLTDLIEDEVAVGELLSYFPARDVEEPATKEFVATQIAGVHREIAELRGEMSTMGSDLRGEMATFDSDLRGEMAAFGAELRGEMAAMSSELRGEMATFGSDLRGEMATMSSDLRGGMAAMSSDLRGEMAAMEGRIIASSSAQLRTMIQWTVGLQISLIGLVVAMGFLQGP